METTLIIILLVILSLVIALWSMLLSRKLDEARINAERANTFNRLIIQFSMRSLEQALSLIDDLGIREMDDETLEFVIPERIVLDPIPEAIVKSTDQLRIALADLQRITG